PKSGLKATRLGRRALSTCAVNERLGGGQASGSRGSLPTMASSMSATSATVRPIGPCTERLSKGSTAGPAATRPGLGRRPTTEQKLAGVRRLPPRSEPCANQTSPVARATAAPPDEPPQVRAVFQ